MPEDDNSHMTRGKLKDMLAGILGGRAAEETVFSDITTGASNDLEKVTEIARNMVQRWGMSEKLGPLVYGKKEELVFLGKELGEQRDYSEAVAQQIDGEVQRIVAEAHETALRVLTENRERLDRVAADPDRDRIARSGRFREGVERRRIAEARIMPAAHRRPRRSPASLRRKRRRLRATSRIPRRCPRE